jgi:hypothetical protein
MQRPSRPAPRPQPRVAAPVPPKPKSLPTVRAQNADEPPAAKPLPPMPTPEQLGIEVPKAMNWSDLRIKLDRLGASGFQLMQHSDGWRFSCGLPGGRTLEGRGNTDADAVMQALRQVESR